jgi:hypothetical protein
LATVGVLGVVVPTAIAGELDDDPLNNRLQVRMSLHCNGDKSVALNWRSIAPKEALSMTAKWYDMTADPDLRTPTPASQAAQVAAVTRGHGTARGRFAIRGVPSGHKIALFIDAWSEAGGHGDQVYGIGRNIDTVHC